MATPKKVSSISLSDTTLSDSDLQMVQINGPALASWLTGLATSNVAVFFQKDTAGDIHLVMAPIEASGHPSSTVQFSSTVLPCPPYCDK
ncbi:MAG: hypothetical protein H6577_04200 [Lewinellaceae bacterium]|nr:hypothetical protein [Saprospiraceae bacterium]MCB9337307.1 hypothetical protein [Lewinellaceae bacterium]